MNGSISRNRLLALSVATAISSFVIPCHAGSTGNGTAGSGQERFGNGMNLQQFRYEADAKKHCPTDSIVWGSSTNPGKFFTYNAGPERVGGFYACMRDAQSAGYEIVNGQ